MKRSGNHAIIQWMLAQGEFVFVNNFIPIAAILRGTRAFPAPREFAAWREGHTAGDRAVCASLEDFPPDVRPFRELPAGATQVLILRDPENFFASRIRKGRKLAHPAYPREPGPMLSRVIDGWKAHAREFLGHTTHLPEKVGVYFNAWFGGEAYRRGISERLGLEFSDAGFGQVSPVGGGSSFDQTAFDGDNKRMQVLDRKTQLHDDEARLLAAIMADEEIGALGRELEAAAGR